MCCVLVARSQQFSFNYYAEREGIPVDQVMRIGQDSSGFMWLGTDRGLYRYDGAYFVSVDRLCKRPFELSQKPINQIRVCSDSTMYVSTYERCYLYNYKRGIAREVKLNGASFKPNIPVKVCPTRQGIFGVSIESMIYRLTGDQATLLQRPAHLFAPGRSPILKDATSDKAGTMWIASSLGLISFDPQRNTYQVYFQYEECTRIQYTRSGDLVVAVYQKGLFRKRAGSGVFEKIQFSLNDQPYVINTGEAAKNIVNIREDKHSGLWLTNLGYQLLYLDSSYRNAVDYSGTYYSAGATLMPEQIYEDRDKDIWCASRNGLIQIKYNYQNFETYLHNPNQRLETGKSNSIKSFYELGNKRILISTYQGMFLTDLLTGASDAYQSFVAYKKGEYLKDQPVINRFYKDPGTGKLWAVSETTTLLEVNRIDHGKKEIYFDEHFPDEMRPLNLGTLFHDRVNQRLLLGGPRVYTYNLVSGKIETLAGTEGTIHYIVPGDRNTAWVCTTTGLYHYNGSTLTKTCPELNDQIVYGGFRDPKSNLLWLTTMDGLYRYDIKSGKTTPYRIKQGLADNYLVDAFPGKNNALWMISAQGISKFYPGENRFHNYTTEDGLANNDLNVHAFLQLSDSTTLIGSVNGFNRVDVDRADQLKTRQYSVGIHSVSIFNHENYSTSVLYTTDRLKLPMSIPFEERNVEFRFSALVYSQGKNQHYQYKLDGFDKEWQHSHFSVPVRYTNLQPGSYTFRVKHTVDGENWVNCDRPFSFVIPPPFYQTWWFILIVVFMFLGVVYLIYRDRLQNAIRVEKVRNRIASDLHDELGGLVTGIALSADLMQLDNAENTNRQRAKILNLSREAIGKLSDVVWSVNSGNDNVGSLRDRVQETLENLLSSTTIEYSLTIDGISDDTQLSAEKRQHIYLVCKEAINNAIKHSNGNRLDITMSNRSDGFRLLVQDNGNAFKDTRKTGHGLNSIRNRAGRLGGIAVIEQTGSGFKIEVKLPKKL
ncbi:MAG: triple tyrosine motif-containing protein [Bacteroidota bacterium]